MHRVKSDPTKIIWFKQIHFGKISLADFSILQFYVYRKRVTLVT